MQDLLRHYENELAFLHGHADDFARANPRIAGHLLLGRDAGEDPHVQRLIQSFALLSSRIHKRLDDDFPLFTEAFLEVLYPHYLRPFPSCSIASFDPASAAVAAGEPLLVERGTMLNTRPVAGVTCRFRTTQDVVLAPIRIAGAKYRAAAATASGSLLPGGGSTAAFSIRLELTAPQASWDTLGMRSLRVHLDGEASQVSLLREVLCGRVTAVVVESASDAPWLDCGATPRQVGFGDDEALIDFDARSHPAYRLLTEYFAFPEKFDFVDLPLPRGPIGTARSMTLHCLMPGLRGDSNDLRLLETLSAKNLRLGCTPIVNLFAQNADPIRVTQAAVAYPVLPDGRRAFGHEVYSIDRVYRVQHTPTGENVVEFRPFYSLQHDALLAGGEAAGRYWSLHRDAGVAERSPGYETEITIVDIDADPASAQTDTLSIDVQATNRDLPTRLTVGDAGGELVVEGGCVARSIRLLKRPTPPQRFDRGHGALWRLVSHLSLNHLSLSQGGIDALRELLRLYDLPRSATNARQVDGLFAIDYTPASACLAGNPFATFVRGMQVRLVVDDQAFAGVGLRLFAEVLDRFFGLYVQANSFVQLVLVSSRSGEVLITCPRRSGDSPLL